MPVLLFKIGSRNIIEWALEANKPTTFNAETEGEAVLAERYGNYPWLQIKARLKDLIPRLDRVAVQTVALREAMELEYANNSLTPDKG